MNDKTLQIIDLTTLKAVISDLRQKMLPSRFEKAQQPDASTLQMGFRTLKGVVWIELSWNAYCPRLIEIKPPAKSGSQSTLAKQIQHGLRNMALFEIHQEGFERVVEFRFSLRTNEPTKRSVILELMGRHSNILMLDEKNQVKTLGKQIRNHQSRLRPISTGDFYQPPPPLNSSRPDKSESFQEWKDKLSLIPIKLKKALQENYQGISPALCLQLADENKEIAQNLLESNVKEISTKIWEDIFKRWILWLRALEKEDFFLSFSGPTSYRVWGAKNYFNKSRKHDWLSLSYYYKSHLEKKRFIELCNDLNKSLFKLKVSEEKLLKHQQLLLSNISQSDFLRNDADKILSIANPTKEQIQKAQSLYQKAKKIRRSKNVLIERIDHHERRISSISESEVFIDNLKADLHSEDTEKIKLISDIKEELQKHLFISKQKIKTQKISNKSNFTILELISPSGLLIQVGRNHRQNEFISIRKARKGDLWFHAQECPGSHVVIKSSLGTIEEEDLQMGADLAAYFSRAKESKRVPIIVVPTDNLQKLKGALPGTVNHHGGEVRWGSPLQVKDLINSTIRKGHNALSSSTNRRD